MIASEVVDENLIVVEVEIGKSQIGNKERRVSFKKCNTVLGFYNTLINNNRATGFGDI